MRNRKRILEPHKGSDLTNVPLPMTNARRSADGFLCTAILVLLLASSFLLATWMRSGGSFEEGRDVAGALHRFPRYGTAAFAQQCGWATTDSQQYNCTILLRPADHETEGISDWVAMAASGFISAQAQGRCRFLMDYGPSVDIHQVLIPRSNYDWTVPPGYQCSAATQCSRAKFSKQLKSKKDDTTTLIPNYRHVYLKGDRSFRIYRENFLALESALPGFRIETGMACALGYLMDLSPHALVDQTHHDHILSTLRDGRNLVMAVYIRSGQTDKAAMLEHLQKRQSADSTTRELKSTSSIKIAEKYIPCVLQMEQQLLSSSSFSRVVWMVVSDSPSLKELISKEYTSENVFDQYDGNVTTRRQMRNGARTPREIITTTSRGVHTRALRNPSTSDFVEAMLDWYLIGESDVVLINGQGTYTFGITSALRTNRPIIDMVECLKMPPFVYEDKVPPTAKEEKASHQAPMKDRDTQPLKLPENLLEFLLEANT